jgi:hypothetical protein
VASFYMFLIKLSNMYRLLLIMIRLWKSDQKIERYFMVLERGSVPFSSKIHGNGIKPVAEKSKVKQELRISNSSNLAERAKKGGYAEKALKAAAFHQAGGSNKKIKFND